MHVCATAPGAFATIGAAIAAAPSGSMIEVCAGTYSEVLVVQGKLLDIRGEAAASTILDAAAGGTALTVRSGGVSVARFTIRGGASSAAGGGRRCEGSSLGVRDTLVTKNPAASGGGLYATGCAVTIAGVQIAENTAEDYGGGALLVNSTGEISGSTIRDNQGEWGGGLTLRDGTVTVRSTLPCATSSC